MRGKNIIVSVTLDDKLIKKAKLYEKRRGVSLSRHVENYFLYITSVSEKEKDKQVGTLRNK
jgi:hypothetical protein